MTTSENVRKAYLLSIVEKQIRKDIPRLMELRERCLVRKDDEVFRIEENPKGDGYYVGRYFYLYEESIAERYEIIGHDIMLNDVLEWLNIINELNTSVFLRKEKFEFQRINEDNKLFIVSWQLSTPYLKDQSEELIKFLYNLIKE